MSVESFDEWMGKRRKDRSRPALSDLSDQAYVALAPKVVGSSTTSIRKVVESA